MNLGGLRGHNSTMTSPYLLDLRWVGEYLWTLFSPSVTLLIYKILFGFKLSDSKHLSSVMAHFISFVNSFQVILFIECHFVKHFMQVLRNVLLSAFDHSYLHDIKYFILNDIKYFNDPYVRVLTNQMAIRHNIYTYWSVLVGTDMYWLNPSPGPFCKCLRFLLDLIFFFQLFFLNLK